MLVLQYSSFSNSFSDGLCVPGQWPSGVLSCSAIKRPLLVFRDELGACCAFRSETGATECPEEPGWC